MIAKVLVQACKGFIRAATQDSSLDNLRLAVTKERSHPDYKDIPHEMVRRGETIQPSMNAFSLLFARSVPLTKPDR